VAASQPHLSSEASTSFIMGRDVRVYSLPLPRPRTWDSDFWSLVLDKHDLIPASSNGFQFIISTSPAIRASSAPPSLPSIIKTREERSLRELAHQLIGFGIPKSR